MCGRFFVIFIKATRVRKRMLYSASEPNNHMTARQELKYYPVLREKTINLLGFYFETA